MLMCWFKHKIVYLGNSHTQKMHIFGDLVMQTRWASSPFVVRVPNSSLEKLGEACLLGEQTLVKRQSNSSLMESGDEASLGESTLAGWINLYFCSNTQLVGWDFYLMSEHLVTLSKFANTWFLWFWMWW